MSTGPAGHTTQSSQCTASHTIEAEQPLCSSRSCATPLLSIQHECRHRAHHLNRCRYRAHHLRHMKYIYCSTGHDLVQSLAYLWPRWLTGAHAELCAQHGRSMAWHTWAKMTSQVVADVDTIQHIAHARDATSNGVAPATRGHNCAGSATGHGMNSTIVVSFRRDVVVPEAMADLSADIAKLTRCTATEHASTPPLAFNSALPTQYRTASQQRKCRRSIRYPTIS